MDQGTMVLVETREAGDVLQGDHAAGATTLSLTSATSFNSLGGTLQIEGSTTPLTYLSANEDTATVVLDPATPLPAAYLDEDNVKVTVLPVETEKWAFVMKTDEEADGEWALVPHNLFDKVEDGIRDPADQEEVEIEWSDLNAQWEVRNILGKRPSVDGGYIVRGTVEDANTPDGLVPPKVLGVTTAAGVKSVYLSWTPVVNDNVTWYWVYGSADPGVPIEESYRLGKSVTNRFTAYSVWDAAVPGMIALSPGAINPETSEYNANLSYFKIVAEDADGLGTASDEVSAEPAVVTTADLAVDSVTSGHMRANSVDADKLDATIVHAGEQYIGQIHLHPTKGITIPQTGSEESTHFASDGTGSQFAGGIVANDGLTSYGGVNMQGTDNFLAGELKAGSGVNDPGTAPTVSSSYDTVSTAAGYTPTDVGGYYRKGLAQWHGTPDNCWVTTDTVSNASNVQAWSKTGGTAFWGFDVLAGWSALGGVTRLGNYYYVLCRQNSNNNNWKILLYLASTEAYAGSYWAGGGTASIGATAHPAIGHDGTFLIVAWVQSGILYVRKIRAAGDPNAGIQTGNTLNFGAWSASHNIAGVQQVDGIIYVTGQSSAAVYAWTPGSTTGTRNTAKDFPKNVGAMTGFMHDGLTWTTYTTGKTFTKHTDLEGQHDFGYDWTDADSGGSGVAHTTLSPLRRVTPTKFAKWTVTLPSFPPDDLTPDGANTARIFSGLVGQSMVLQHQLVTDGDGVTGKPLSLSKTFTSLATTGTAPNASNDFANRPGSIGRFASTKALGADPMWHLDGDGSGRAGVEWNSNGERIDVPYILLTNPQRQTIADSTFNGAETGIRWVNQNQKVDPAGIFTSNQALGSVGSVQVSKAGLYHFDAKFTIGSNTSGTLRQLNVKVNNSGIWGYDSATPAGAGGTSLTAIGRVRLSAGDYLNCTFNHNATVALGIYGSSAGICHFIVRREGD